MSVQHLSAEPRRAFKRYESLGLTPLLHQIRRPGRYDGLDGWNILTNAELPDSYDMSLVVDEIHRAARHREVPYTSELAVRKQGLSYGLNPYTDWSLAQFDGPPDRWVMILGLDWYSVSTLLPEGYEANRWFDFIADPFMSYDPYWFNLWGWLLEKYHRAPSSADQGSWNGRATSQEAAEFVRQHRIGFIFHNLIPYLRPADVASTAANWPQMEWRKKAIRADVGEDLRLILELTDGRMETYCTNQEIKTWLLELGLPNDRVTSFGAHPSRVFNPTHFRNKSLFFSVGS